LISVFPKLTNKYALKSATERTVAVLKDARSDTLASHKDNSYGVHFSTSTITFFSGKEYVEGDAENRKMKLSQRVKVQDISFSDGGNEIIFERLSGKALVYGTTTIALTEEDLNTTIYIQPSGLIEIEK